MSDTFANVLGLPSDTRAPNAYQVLGLNDGEADAEQIKTAIQAAVDRLKSVQSDTDPAAWKKAATAVTKARKLLTDPAAKARYDAKLSGSKPRRASSQGEAIRDPLRGLLPKTDPLAPFDVDAAAQRASEARPFQPPPLPPKHSAGVPSANDGSVDEFDDENWWDDEPAPITSRPPIGPARAESPPIGPPPAALHSTGSAETPLAPTQPVAVPQVSRSSVRRRKRSPLGLLLACGLLLVVAGGSAWGVYALLQQQGGSDPQVAQGNEPPAKPRRPSARSGSDDPVMGNIGNGSAPTVDPSAVRPRPQDMGTAPEPLEMQPANDMQAGAGMQPGDNVQPMTPTATPPTGPEMMMEVTPTQPEMEPEPEPMPAGPSPAELESGAAAIAVAENAIKNRDWKQMKGLAEMAQAAAADETQKKTADQLFEVADLADYYYGGIIKALEDQNSGDTFELTEGVQVGVVESSSQGITLQVAGRPKPFPFDQMPFVLVHRLGNFTMDSSGPSVPVAKAVYQCMAVKANAADRAQALGWLEQMPAEVEVSHPHEIAQTLKRLFPDK